jgi:antitoxin component HigA of HigAB toxin-antitoxin module
MILAVRKTGGRPAPESVEQIRTLMKFYGIQCHTLVARCGMDTVR